MVIRHPCLRLYLAPKLVKKASLGAKHIDTGMKIIILLIIVSLIVALGFLSAFLWAVRSGQYDDDVGPAVRILFDEGSEPATEENSQTKTTSKKS
jgi:cbb3-type cytochrome oxidase maturation protein